MPINWNLMDTQYPAKLADLFNPQSVQARQSEISNRDTANQLRQMQIVQAAQQMRRAPELQRREDVTWQTQQQDAERKRAVMDMLRTGTPEQRKQALIELFPEKAAEQEFKPPTARDFNQPFLPTGEPNKAYQQWELAKQRAGASGAAPKLQYDPQSNSFIEPPSAQNNWTPRAIPVPGLNKIPQTKPMTADQEAKFLERWSKDYKEVEGAKSSAQEIAKAAKQVREAKGLSGATGIQAYIPSYPGSEASQAEVDIETLKGKVTSMGKALMSASGSIGPMAIQEWKIVSDAVAALDPKKLSPEKLKQQIGLIESQAVGMAERFNDVYGRQYQDYYEKYPQMRMGQQQYGNSGDDSAAIAWAQANPNDPRAVKIMSLHGR